MGLVHRHTYHTSTRYQYLHMHMYYTPKIIPGNYKFNMFNTLDNFLAKDYSTSNVLFPY